MFQEQQKDALRWFCHWAFGVSRRGPGKKILFVDELWRFVDAHSLPAELEKEARMGRAEGLELLTATQHPQLFLRLEHLEHSRPGKPQPTHRDA